MQKKKSKEEEITYVTEAKSFIVNGVTMAENTLTEQEVKRLMKKAKKASLLIGSKEHEGQRIV